MASANWYIDPVLGSDTKSTFSATITGISKASTAVVTCSGGHSYETGQRVYISGVGGMTQVNGLWFTITRLSGTTFELQGVDSTAYSNYTSGGTAQTQRKIITAISKANPAVVSCIGHGFSNGDKVILVDIEGMTELYHANGYMVTVANKTADTFELSGIDSSSFGTFTGGEVLFPVKLPNVLFGFIGFTATSEYNDAKVFVPKTLVNDSSIQKGSGNIVFTNDSVTVTTSVDLRSVIAVGDLIGKTTARGDGWASGTRPEIYYRVEAITASAITLSNKYTGTTATVSAVNRLRSGTEMLTWGSASATGATCNRNSVVITGGYDFSGGAITKTGETWVEPVSQSGGSYYTINAGGNGYLIEYINTRGSASAGRGFLVAGSNGTYQYCHVGSGSTATNYRFEIIGTNNTLKYCTAESNGNSSGHPFYINSTTVTLINCYGVGSTTGSSVFHINASGTIMSGCRAEHSVIGSNLLALNSQVQNTYFYKCSSGCVPNAGNNLVDTCTFDTCGVGVAPQTTTYECWIKDCSFDGCTTRDITATQCFDFLITGCTFNNSTQICNPDQYSRNFTFRRCAITNLIPSVGITGAINQGIYYFIDCTIDAKTAFAVTAGTAKNNYPQYVTHNSFGLANGQWYANGEITQDSTTFKTSSPSLKLLMNTSTNRLPYEICAFPVNSGVAKTVTYYIKSSSASWAGTITPVLTLNGRTIKTGSNITSLNNADWTTSYTLSATSGEINVDGSLALAFIYNANNFKINVDDITIA